MNPVTHLLISPSRRVTGVVKGTDARLHRGHFHLLVLNLHVATAWSDQDWEDEICGRGDGGGGGSDGSGEGD